MFRPPSLESRTTTVTLFNMSVSPAGTTSTEVIILTECSRVFGVIVNPEIAEVGSSRKLRHVDHGAGLRLFRHRVCLRYLLTKRCHVVLESTIFANPQ